MGACAKQTFNNVTDAVWQCCRQKVAQYDVHIDADSGSTTAHGIKVAWNYNRAGEVLEIQVLDKPFYITCSAANGELHKAIDDCYNAHGAAPMAMMPD